MTRPDPRKIEFLDTDLIEVGNRRRQVDEASVVALAASFEKIGMRTPISVRYYPERPETAEGDTDDALVLMTGAHRLAAAKKLGWEQIECFVYYDGDEIDAQLWEIAENLHRAELTALERDEQVALWVRLNQERIDASQSETHQKAGQQPGGVNAAARELGLSKPDAHRAVKVAGLSEEAKEAAKEAGLDDNRSALLEAAKAEPDQQAKIIRDIAEKKTADRSRIDADVKTRAAREVASILAEHVPGEAWDGLKANLYAAGASNIANELTNITGQSLMDRRFG